MLIIFKSKSKFLLLIVPVRRGLVKISQCKMASNNNARGGKKKRSFLYKARKYGKKGMYGRGKNVDEETYNYFVRVMERLKEEFEDEDDKGSKDFQN